jgi:hypothetical protein
MLLKKKIAIFVHPSKYDFFISPNDQQYYLKEVYVITFLFPISNEI